MNGNGPNAVHVGESPRSSALTRSSAGLRALDRPPRPGFANPLLRAPAQDPHVLWHGGLYHYCESSPHGVFVRSAPHFLGLDCARPKRIWAPPARGPAARNLWAPELHFLDGRFHVYFAADDGRNENHRMWVLAARTVDPAGDYELAGQLETEGWAIDGTVLTTAPGRRYFVWSGWPGARNGCQQLYVAPMSSPVTLGGPRVLLASPTREWERRGLPICEGPQILQRAGRTFLVYSASGSWTSHYCLGLLVLDGGDPLDPRAWHHAGRCFQPNHHGWGVGHCGFVTAPDGTDWLLYHAKTSRRLGWSDREVRAQPFTWRADGLPDFGAPLARGVVQVQQPVDLSRMWPRSPVERLVCNSGSGSHGLLSPRYARNEIRLSQTNCPQAVSRRQQKCRRHFLQQPVENPAALPTEAG